MDIQTYPTFPDFWVNFMQIFGHPNEISDFLAVGVQDRKIKMVFNTGGTWRQVTFEKLMMKIYDFF